MEPRTYSSSQARAEWRDILDLAAAGVDVIIERHGKPVVAIITYADYLGVRDKLDAWRGCRAGSLEKHRQWIADHKRGQR